MDRFHPNLPQNEYHPGPSHNRIAPMFFDWLCCGETSASIWVLDSPDEFDGQPIRPTGRCRRRTSALMPTIVA